LLNSDASFCQLINKYTWWWVWFGTSWRVSVPYGWEGYRGLGI